MVRLMSMSQPYNFQKQYYGYPVVKSSLEAQIFTGRQGAYGIRSYARGTVVAYLY